MTHAKCMKQLNELSKVPLNIRQEPWAVCLKQQEVLGICSQQCLGLIRRHPKCRVQTLLMMIKLVSIGQVFSTNFFLNKVYLGYGRYPRAPHCTVKVQSQTLEYCCTLELLLSVITKWLYLPNLDRRNESESNEKNADQHVKGSGLSIYWLFSSCVQWKSDSKWKRKSEEWKLFQKLKFTSWECQAIKQAGELRAQSTPFWFLFFLLFVSVQRESWDPFIWLLCHRYVILKDFCSILIKGTP